MGAVSFGTQENERIWNWTFIAGLLGGLVLRFQLATVAQTPGHGDSAFYYTVAKNIVDGRGIVVDYVVYYFNGLTPIPHYAGDFWNPLAAILLSLPMMVLGKSVFNALLASIAAGITPALIGYLAAKKYSNSAAFASLTGILVFFSPYQVWVSTLTEAIIFFGAFGSLAIYFAIKGREAPRHFLISALCTGLAHLTRQDGVLLLITLLLCIFLAPFKPRKKMAVAFAAFGIHLLVLSPLLIRNYTEFHALMPPGPAQTMFLTTYEDFHAYGKELNWNTLRATWGIRGIVQKRLHTAAENLAQIEYFLSPVLLLLTIAGIANALLSSRKSRDLSLFLPAGLFACLEYLFYTLIASFSGPGTLPKGLAILLPFICILIVDLFEEHIRPRMLLAFAVFVLASYLGYRGYQSNYQSAVYYNEIYEKYKTVHSIILDDAHAREISANNIVVMGRNTWDIYEGTGFKSIMVPNNDLETIYFVARQYGAQYILLPAPRKALEGIYAGDKPDARFALVAQVPETDWKIFRIKFPP